MVGQLDIQGHDSLKRVYDPNGIAPTLTTVQGGYHHAKILDNFRVRRLTPTEYGRLQAFPVDTTWRQVVSDSQAYKQFGNAVTVSVAKAVIEAVKHVLQF